MVLIKVLKRRDASSVVVAILLAMILEQPLVSVTGRLASWISDLHSNQGYGFGGFGGGWKQEYLFPIVWALVQIIILEVLGWIYVFVTMPMKKRRK